MKNPLSHIILSFLLFLPALTVAQSALLWQGFNHKWTYNHRVNRLGDYILNQGCDDDTCRAEWVHTAASGSGADMGNFDLQAVWVEWPGAQFQTGKFRLKLEGREGKCIQLDTLMPICGMSPYSVLFLNGFDLVTSEGQSADKLVKFSLLTQGWKSAGANAAQAFLNVQLEMDCSTPECPKFNQEVGYDLDIYWIAVHPATELSTNRERVSHEFKWDKQNPRIDPQTTVTGQTYPTEQPTVWGIRGFSIGLDDEVHYQSVDLSWHFDSTGMPAPEIAFNAWHPEMREGYKTWYEGTKLPAKMVVKKSKGSGQLEIFGVACTDSTLKKFPVSENGQLHWQTKHGHQESASGPDAEFRKPLQFVPPGDF